MLGVSELYGNETQLYQRLINNIGFGIRVSIPGIVQSYDRETRTVEVQPAIRERVIAPEGEITFQEIPMITNVPVCFPQVGNYSISMPISQGDECLLVFTDLPYDNWWLTGGIQNPIEMRRHDLTDAIAIFGIKNQDKIASERAQPPNGQMGIYNTATGVGINIGTDDGTLTAIVSRDGGSGLESVSFSSIIKLVNPE